MIRAAVRGFGQLLISVGLVVLLFAGYEVYGKGFEVGNQQGRLNNSLEQQWHAPLPSKAAVVRPVEGKGMAKLFLPTIGKDWVVVEGVQPKDIRLAPGHYPESQLPGEEGNFAVAGHRMPSVFWDLDKMKAGDPMVVETATTWIVYTVTRVQIVLPTEVGVVAPDPDRPSAAKGTRRIMTLTTCNPKWDNYQRLIVHGEVSRELPKSMGRPVEIAGMKG
jgi:sortase A